MVRVFTSLLLLIVAACTNGSLGTSESNQEFTNQTTFTNALYFDGLNDYVDISHPSNLDPDTATAYTIEMWVRPTGGSGYRTLWAMGDYLIQIDSGNQFYVATSTVCMNYAGSAVTLPGSNLSSGSNHHVAFVRSGTGTIYICADATCGSLQGITQLNCPLATTRLGSKLSGAQYYTGYIDEIRISSIARYPGGGGYTVPTGPFVLDGNTTFLFHANYPNGTISGLIAHPMSNSFNLFSGAYFTTSPF